MILHPWTMVIVATIMAFGSVPRAALGLWMLDDALLQGTKLLVLLALIVTSAVWFRWECIWSRQAPDEMAGAILPVTESTGCSP